VQMKTTASRRIEMMLSKTGLKKTRQRIDILKVLVNAKRPLTAEQIGCRLAGESPNKVTIYRTIESFVDAGLVHRAYLRDRTQHYELGEHCTQMQCHPHFTCTKCGSTRCMPDSTVGMVKGLEQGFVVHRQQVRLEGICPRCA
jgi:Fur family ferric uptake transcriptional regulator